TWPSFSERLLAQRASKPVRVRWVSLGPLGFLNAIQLAGTQILHGLGGFSCERPVDNRLLDHGILAQAKVQPPVVLRAKAARAGHFLPLMNLLAAAVLPVQGDIRADC